MGHYTLFVCSQIWTLKGLDQMKAKDPSSCKMQESYGSWTFLHWWPPSLGALIYSYLWIPRAADLYVKMCRPHTGTLIWLLVQNKFWSSISEAFREAVSDRKFALLNYVRNSKGKIKQLGNPVVPSQLAQRLRETQYQEDLPIQQPLKLSLMLLRLGFDSASDFSDFG